MWKVYKWNGHYIQGDLISKHSSEDAALKRAAKEMKFTFQKGTGALWSKQVKDIKIHVVCKIVVTFKL